MRLLERLSILNFKKTLFRRDAELSFYSGNPFPLPAMADVKDISNFKYNYPFNFISGLDEITVVRELLLGMESRSDIISDAESAFGNFFDFPSSGKLPLGERIRWNYDYTSGFEWKAGLCWKQDHFDFPKGTDIVNPWLMGRLNQLVLLGKGYLASGDEKYTEKYKQLLEQFIDENPFCASVNWQDTAEVSIRLLNIIFSLPFFIWSEKTDSGFINSLRKWVLIHSVFIENNLPADKGYGYLISTAALAASGLILKDSRYGERLLHISHSSTEEIIRKQFSAEGVAKVGSILFFPHMIEALFILKSSFGKINIDLSKLFEEKYAKTFNVLASMLRDDNSIAAIGDEFAGRLIPLCRAGSLKYSFPLALGCAGLDKGFLKHFVPSPTMDVLFYLGKDAVAEYDSIPERDYQKISYGYADSGIFILRNNDIHITVDVSEIGSDFSKTAGHNDILSFELYYKGHKIITDPGTYSFYSDNLVRYKLRSVKSHNSIYIDDEEPVELEGVFNIKEDLTKPKITEWHSDEHEDILSVQHYAYARFIDPVIIKRIFRLKKETNKLTIRDELFGGSTHRAFINLIFDPGIILIKDDNSRFIFSDPVKGEVLFHTPADVLICSVQDTLFSGSYGSLSETKKITAAVSAKLPVHITTEIILA